MQWRNNHNGTLLVYKPTGSPKVRRWNIILAVHYRSCDLQFVYTAMSRFITDQVGGSEIWLQV